MILLTKMYTLSKLFLAINNKKILWRISWSSFVVVARLGRVFVRDAISRRINESKAAETRDKLSRGDGGKEEKPGRKPG